jgi:hypothetical protein
MGFWQYWLHRIKRCNETRDSLDLLHSCVLEGQAGESCMFKPDDSRKRWFD